MKTGLEVVVYTFFGVKMILSLPSSFFLLVEMARVNRWNAYF